MMAIDPGQVEHRRRSARRRCGGSYEHAHAVFPCHSGGQYQYERADFLFIIWIFSPHYLNSGGVKGKSDTKGHWAAIV
jgi:hypothetical protein